jgi:hypothetical protein
LGATNALWAAAAGAVAGGIAWLALVFRARIAPVTGRQLLVFIVLVGLGCRIALALFTPVFYAPDEQPHFNYVQYLAEYRSLPVQSSVTDAPTQDYEYYQPPLYYVLLTPLFALLKAVSNDMRITLVGLRLVSVALFGVTLAAALAFLKNLKVRDPFVWTFTICMVALLPTYVFLSSMMNNDNLVIAFGALVLLLMSRPGSTRNAALTGVVVGLALLTKLSAVVYVALVILLPLIECVRRRSIEKGALARAGLTCGTAMVIWSPVAIRNLTVYGSVTAEDVANVPRAWESLYAALATTSVYMHDSFWAVAGVFNNVWFYPQIGRFIALVGFAGLAYATLFKREMAASLVGRNRSVLLAAGLAIAVNVVLVYRFGLLYGQGQGRFLFPLLIPLSLLLAIGFRVLPVSSSKRAHLHVAGFFVTYALAFTCFCLAVFYGAPVS